MIRTMTRQHEDAAWAARPAAVAGRFYARQPDKLLRSVQKYLDSAPDHKLSHVRALIAPHAGYVCSGPVAAVSFKAFCSLPATTYTVYLLAPAHWQAVHGVGLSSAAWFETPLGLIPVAGERVNALLSLGAPYHLADGAHAPEHSLEVELPFLQTVLSDVRVVPMLFDQETDPEHISADLAVFLAGDEKSLVVVSSDLSHYHSYQEAYTLDRAFLAALVANDLEETQRGQACGMMPILTLMHIAKRLHWQPHLLAYANSGDTCGSREKVVGYGAVAYTA
jgi:AmmeMemoRadiSam system protein B